MTRKVLIIGYLHPLTRPGGSVRLLPLAQHLPEFGWEPVVLTPHLSDIVNLPFRVIETPYRDALGFWKRLFGFDPDKDIKRQVKERFGTSSKNSLINFMLTRAGEILNYPDPHKGWKSFALKAGNQLLQQEKVDAIISCHPVTSHIVASDLKAKYRIPWVADFADLWSQNHNYSYGRLRKFLDMKLERRTLARADALVATAHSWAEKLAALHPGKTVYTTAHGFDPAAMNNPPVSLTAKFTITYTGNIYTGKQDPAKLFAALRDLLVSNTVHPDDIEVRFYGDKYDWLEKEIERYELGSIVKQYGRVPREVAWQRQGESQLLLQLGWEGRQSAGYPGKLFDYLAARRPILATGGSYDVSSQLLDETKAGIWALTVPDIKNILKELYREYKLKGELTYKGDASEVNKYTHQEMVRGFSRILDSLTQK